MMQQKVQKAGVMLSERQVSIYTVDDELRQVRAGSRI